MRWLERIVIDVPADLEMGFAVRLGAAGEPQERPQAFQCQGCG
jgi:hypothetical protein